MMVGELAGVAQRLDANLHDCGKMIQKERNVICMNEIRFARLRPDAALPTRRHADDAGLDLYAVEEAVIEPGAFAVVGTGVCFDLERGWVGLILLKSRSNYLLGGGVVDAGYQGEIRIKIANPTNAALQIEKYQAIAQLLILPIVTPAVTEVPAETIYAARSDRGASGGIHLSF